MSSESARHLAEALGLGRYGDRGWWFRETWRAPTTVTIADGSTRPAASTSMCLMPAGESARWHRSLHDQVWFAHSGLVVLQHGGSHAEPDPGPTYTLSTDVGTGRVAQAHVPAGEWYRILSGSTDALMSFLSSPGFEPSDLEVLEVGTT